MTDDSRRRGPGRARHAIRSQRVDLCLGRGDHGSHALCRYRRYRVHWPPRRVRDPVPRNADAEECGCWCVAESLAQFERLAAEWGERAKPLVGDLTAPDLGLSDETIGRARRRRPRGALRCDLRHHRRRRRPARRQRRRHPGGDRPRHAPRRHAAPRVVDRGGGQLPRRVHRGRLRRRTGVADAVSPDQVRGRAAGAFDGGAALSDLPARGGRRGLANRRDGQGRRAVLLLRDPRQAGPAAQAHADRAAGHRAHQHRAGRLRGRRVRRVDARRRPRRADLPPHRTEDDRAARHLPRRRPRGRPATAARHAAERDRDAVPQGHRTGQGAAQHGGHAAGHPGGDPRRRRPGPDVHRRQCVRGVAGHGNRACPSSPRTRRSCGGTGPSTSTPTGPDATTRQAHWSAGTSSSPARPAASDARRRSPSPNAAQWCSPWPAMPRRSTT